MQKFPFDEIDALYRDIILKHYRNSSDRVAIDEPDIEYDEYNPICGDRVVIQLKVKDARIEESSFHGEGCSISQASASIMADILTGKTLEEALRLAEGFRHMMQAGASSGADQVKLGDLAALQAVRKFPVRIKCALLGWTALEEGIEEFRSGAQ